MDKLWDVAQSLVWDLLEADRGLAGSAPTISSEIEATIKKLVEVRRMTDRVAAAGIVAAAADLYVDAATRAVLRKGMDYKKAIESRP